MRMSGIVFSYMVFCVCVMWMVHLKPSPSILWEFGQVSNIGKMRAKFDCGGETSQIDNITNIYRSAIRHTIRIIQRQIEMVRSFRMAAITSRCRKRCCIFYGYRCMISSWWLLTFQLEWTQFVIQFFFRIQFGFPI